MLANSIEIDFSTARFQIQSSLSSLNGCSNFESEFTNYAHLLTSSIIQKYGQNAQEMCSDKEMLNLNLS
ncbi:hypothetical protein L1887_62567 [Cichorium endivia]|nr:hypothetical protein L1887_62567 [Cichorium endivia]